MFFNVFDVFLKFLDRDDSAITVCQDDWQEDRKRINLSSSENVNEVKRMGVFLLFTDNSFSVWSSLSMVIQWFPNKEEVYLTGVSLTCSFVLFCGRERMVHKWVLVKFKDKKATEKITANHYELFYSQVNEFRGSSEGGSQTDFVWERKYWKWKSIQEECLSWRQLITWTVNGDNKEW